MKEISQERAESRDTNPVEEVTPEIVRKFAERAKSDTVTASRLMGDEQYFTEVLSFLEQGEQPPMYS